MSTAKPTKAEKADRPRKTFAHQSQEKLGPLPVPNLGDTCDKYLRSLGPLLTQEELQQTTNIVNDFRKPGGDGEHLQRLLQQRSEEQWAQGNNWLEDWWLKYAYMAWPDPICVGSNFYIILDDPETCSPGVEPAFQAARMTHGMCLFKQAYDAEQLPAAEYMGAKPLDMNQYKSLFTTARIPGENGDTMTWPKPSNKIVVISKRQFYVVDVFGADGRATSVHDLEAQFRRIIDDSHASPLPENGVGVATGTNRPDGARIRQALQQDGGNRANLQTIDEALFVVCLDDAKPVTWDERGLHIIAGDANNRWFDKNFQLIVFSNGVPGFNGEHCPLDAPAHVPGIDFMVAQSKSWVAGGGYPPGDKSSPSLPPPQKLRWTITADVARGLKKAEQDYVALFRDVDLRMLLCAEAAPKRMKQLKVSPDSFIQMVLQLAYFKLNGKGCATYETGQTRQFWHGRTETVRSFSLESACMTAAVSSPHTPIATKKQLLLKAIEGHKKYMLDVVNGKGCDRHLLGMKILALEEMAAGKRKALPAIYTDKAFSESSSWRLSTSNIPGPKYLFGGFGNVMPDGYGVCYITRQETTNFGVVSRKSCPHTSSEKMAQAINQSAKELAAILEFENEPKPKL
eukprot:TRINITY_DN9949_c0_g1_i2.p1 TRINITY_DN9949_c0_g1~~TRINITY_DN9949_c0_g1_i2.p1  ORF type:complete len:626 (+),score=142.42 TRINITY_DN9949_c0_g1_i2:105-1982(+)